MLSDLLNGLVNAGFGMQSGAYQKAALAQQQAMNAQFDYATATWLARHPPEPPPPLPFFLDPEQIRELTPEIDWNERVGDRIRAFKAWAREREAA